MGRFKIIGTLSLCWHQSPQWMLIVVVYRLQRASCPTNRHSLLLLASVTTFFLLSAEDFVVRIWAGEYLANINRSGICTRLIIAYLARHWKWRTRVVVDARLNFTRIFSHFYVGMEF